MGRRKPLPPPRVYATRLVRNAVWVSGFIVGALGIGVLGYRYFLELDWVDALLNASMILTGMGPVDAAKTTGGKLFASGYALFSGVFFLSATAFLLAPAAQHFLHRFHLEMYGDDGEPIGQAPVSKPPQKSASPQKPAAQKSSAPGAAAGGGKPAGGGNPSTPAK